MQTEQTVQSVGGFFNPSKGIDYYAYLGDSQFSIQFQKPSSTTPWGTPGQMLANNFQISESDIGMLEHTGRFQWHLKQNGNEIASRYAEIAPSDGSLGDCNMANMMQTPSLVSPGYAVSYGFYDSGSGKIGTLTNQDQSYVYATANLSNWMRDLVNASPAVGSAPFNCFVLPGAHDAGMFDLNCCQTLLNNDTFRSNLGAAVGVGIATLPTSVVNRIIINLAFTQKDTVNTMLDLGIRYFDFRPGYCITDPTAAGGLYHQHNFIPGYSYEQFLQNCLSWLMSHPTEIVVVALGHSGFNKDFMRASTDTLSAYLDGAMQATHTAGEAGEMPAIVVGDKSDLSSSYNNLIAARKRLIFLNQYGFPNDAAKYDSYNDGYQTTDINVILSALNNMNAGGQNGNDYTVLQLQGTASGAGGGIFGSVATLNDASSPLMSTKAKFDNATYSWLMNNVPGRFSNQQLLVCLNDFADNALTQICSTLTRQRAGA
ncbi:hypothetical protein ACFQ4C_03310 [Larkinella insperata]|uniref:Uncharacterized protein n=1 Tax=Larkinella insperata TaxID=332158 RepID=A0ABW3Q6F5_9BACT|nr:hypothetical protein [Larkinella insperata]